ncbi:Ligand-gated ion channel 50 [Trichinella nativa]|nr:Ligand-gated ion channel 50 [Trichinella sp. T9]KRZ61188.1 Ligand-gated ion channel 50 [Trichinella nativa]KRZ97723.1 Ligand-gated ion channel 50 [Trichinella sp. T8]
MTNFFTYAWIYLFVVRMLPNFGVSYAYTEHHSLWKAEFPRCTKDSEIIERLLSTYNRNKVPGGMASVKLEVWVQEITSISDITSDFNIDLYVSELWLDPALSYSHMNPCKQNLSLNNEILKHLWTPNSCFINSKTAEIHESPFPNIFLLIYPNGTVWTNYRLTLTGPCTMDLTAFPFDSVTCQLTFESFNYNTDEVKMSWTDIGVEPMREKMELADYMLENIVNFRNEVSYPAGKWHELTMQFKFKRRPGWYILQAYLPTFLTIFISWIAFCLGTKAIPARTMLGVNALLAMTFQFGNVIRNLPRVSYVKAIDVWMLSCMTFVFCSLLELAWVGYLSRKANGFKRPPTSAARNQSSHKHKRKKTVMLKNEPKNYGTMNFDMENFHSIHHLNRNNSHTNVTTAFPFFDSDDPYEYRPPGLQRQMNVNLFPKSYSYLCKCQQRLNQSNSYNKLKETTANQTENQFYDYDSLALKIDHISCFVFPTLFVLFNIFYWCYYLT